VTSPAVQIDDFSVTSSDETPEQIKANFATEDKAEPLKAKPAKPIPPVPAEPTRNPDGKFRPAENVHAEPAKDADEDASEDEQDERPEHERPLGKPRHDPRARMLQATRQAAEAKRERDALAAEKARLEAELAELRKPPAAPSQPTPRPGTQADGDPEPQEDQFENYRDYVKAQARWEARQEFAARQQEAHQREQAVRIEAALEKRVTGFREKIETFAKADPTFAERVSPEILDLKPLSMLERGERPTVWNAIAEEIVGSADAPRLMLHLSEHPDDLQRLATLGPRDLVREIARIETRLDAVTAGAAPPAVSKAKPPVRPVTGSPHAAVSDIDSDEVPFDEYVVKANARDRRPLPRR
jgi:hypothetical protein